MITYRLVTNNQLANVAFAVAVIRGHCILFAPIKKSADAGFLLWITPSFIEEFTGIRVIF